MRIPGDRFDGCDVIREAVQRRLLGGHDKPVRKVNLRRFQPPPDARSWVKRTSDILSNTKSLLSFPPLASWLSSLHLSPHTSCRCTASLLTQWFLIRTSRW
jgi:hypothetical protein